MNWIITYEPATSGYYKHWWEVSNNYCILRWSEWVEIPELHWGILL
jgi:hypothetical protein